jgi:hypothetical protein
MIELFTLEGCIVDNGRRVDLQALRQKMEDGTFNVELFNQMIKNDCSFIVKSTNHTVE